jgi:hypothetical protein
MIIDQLWFPGKLKKQMTQLSGIKAWETFSGSWVHPEVG